MSQPVKPPEVVSNKPATKTNSQASSGSTASQDSAGIGSGIAPKDVFPRTENLPPNLTPEGSGLDSSIKVYDAIVYLIYCPEHDKIAVTNVERARCVWLPFAILPESVTWKVSICFNGLFQFVLTFAFHLSRKHRTTVWPALSATETRSWMRQLRPRKRQFMIWST